MANWKAHGPDLVQGFWVKKLTSIHIRLQECLQKCILEGKVPEWMVKGRTTLIMKDEKKGQVAGNYRPIT